MQGEDDLRGLAKIMALMRAVSILIVLMHLYWYCYSFFLERGWTLAVIDRILHNFQKTANLFSYPIYTKVFALVLLALSCLGTKGVKNEKITWLKINAAIFFGFVLYFLNTPLLLLAPVNGDFFYIVTLAFGYIVLMMAGLWMHRLLTHHLITAMLLLIYKRANNLGYRTAKRRIAMELRDMITAILILFAGGNPDKVFKT